MKKITSLILALALVVSSLSVAVYAKNVEADNIPCVIVPGIGQSRVWLVDEYGEFVYDENGEKINCFPAVFDIESVLANIAGPLALSVAAQKDAGLSDALCKELQNAFSMNETKNNGKPCGRVVVEEYPHSLAECTQDEKDYIFNCVPMERLCETLGEDHLYYYTYNSLGNALDIVDGLYEYIQLVKKQTGHDKVNIVPISMGGAIFNGLMELYPEVSEDIHRIIFVIPALNGSTMVSDIYERELTFLNADYLYSDMLDELLDEATASTIEIAIRILPKEVLMTCIEKAVDTLMDTVITNCTGLWMLVPQEEYDKCVEMNLSDKSKTEIKRQTDIFHKAQVNSKKNITAFKQSGIEVFDIVDYDYALYNIGNSWDKENADGIIQTASTSMGAKMSCVGETLPVGYVQQNTYCSNPEHNHISPDRVVDASTGLLPDQTFYFDGQSHAYTDENDIIMRLCCELVESDRITDVYSDSAFPQFNIGRMTKKLRKELLPIAEDINRATLNIADAEELDNAVKAAEDMLSRTIAVYGEAPAVEARLRAILEKIGAVESQTEESALSPAMKRISDLLYQVGGANGYIDMGQNMIDGLIGGASEGEGSEVSGGNETTTAVDNVNSGSTESTNTDSAAGSEKTTESAKKPQIVDNPKTGGYNYRFLEIAVPILSGVGITAFFVFKKRKNINNESDVQTT